MRIFNKISDYLHYRFDAVKSLRVPIRIEQFSYDTKQKKLIVIYRHGRTKITNKMNISQFEKNFFERISQHDQHRLTKFSTFQNLVDDLFINDPCSHEDLARYIDREIKNERLF